MQRKEQIMNHPKRQRRRPSLMRTVLRMTGMLAALQAMIVIVLQVVSAQRQRQRPEGSFPHPYLDEVSVGANCLQIYDDGRDLYDAMLAAIDAAQESIYWKPTSGKTMRLVRSSRNTWRAKRPRGTVK
jgi:phosphatidylserine/phosphatidylglycerophosphate/cardiolipin synthase-like enzyme